MTKLDNLFKKKLRQAIKEGFDHHSIDCLAGVSERKLTLTEAEVEAGKRLYKLFMEEQLYKTIQEQGWLFGCIDSSTGLVPEKLSRERRGLNRPNWHLYKQL